MNKYNMVTKLQTADLNMITLQLPVHKYIKYHMIFQNPSRKCVYFSRILTDIVKKYKYIINLIFFRILSSYINIFINENLDLFCHHFK